MSVASSYPRQNLLMQSTGNRVSLPVFFSSSKKKKKIESYFKCFFFIIYYIFAGEKAHIK